MTTILLITAIGVFAAALLASLLVNRAQAGTIERIKISIKNLEAQDQSSEIQKLTAENSLALGELQKMTACYKQLLSKHMAEPINLKTTQKTQRLTFGADFSEEDLPSRLQQKIKG